MRTTIIEQAGSGELWEKFELCNLLVLASWNHSQDALLECTLLLILHIARKLCNHRESR